MRLGCISGYNKTRTGTKIKPPPAPINVPNPPTKKPMINNSTTDGAMYVLQK
jgi:hypothetical protein